MARLPIEVPDSREVGTIIYVLQCVKCAHQWEVSTGWLPRACPECRNNIEHGDHLSAHVRIVNTRIERCSS
jgi:hypothetical protein